MEEVVISKILWRGAVAVVVLANAAAFARATQRPDPANACNALVGSWKLAAAKYGGNEFNLPPGTTTVKHVTPAQFMWTSYGADGTITRAAGGAYTLKGNAYQETPEYGMSDDFDVVKGKPQAFTCRIDANKWYHNGSLSNGTTVEEVWERIEPR
jgi:hypothetical protein